MFRIMVVEDDVELRELFCAVLSDHGYLPLPAADGTEALEMLEHSYVDLIISDVMMPRMDGFELIRQLPGANYNMPILVITARDGLEDKRTGFRAGTDDYMVKPIDLDELLLHVQALLRRSQAMTSHQLTVGQTHLDYDSLTVQRGDTLLTLPKKEFFLLFKLLSSPMQIFTRRQLMDEIWGMDAQSDERTVDVHIKRLREKCEIFPDFSIVTVRGLGYKAVKNG